MYFMFKFFEVYVGVIVGVYKNLYSLRILKFVVLRGVYEMWINWLFVDIMVCV